MEWISVDDRLPEIGRDYLVTDGIVCMVAAFRTQAGIWDFWTIKWWDTSDVTHWMPLPEPPKEDTP